MSSAITWANFDLLFSKKVKRATRGDFAECDVLNLADITHIQTRTLGQILSRLFLYYHNNVQKPGESNIHVAATIRVIVFCRTLVPLTVYHQARRVAVAVLSKLNPTFYTLFHPSNKDVKLEYNKGWFKRAARRLNLNAATLHRTDEISICLEMLVQTHGAEKVTIDQLRSLMVTRMSKKAMNETIRNHSFVVADKVVTKKKKKNWTKIDGYLVDPKVFAFEKHAPMPVVDVRATKTAWFDETDEQIPDVTTPTGIFEDLVGQTAQLPEFLDPRLLVDVFIITKYVFPPKGAPMSEVVLSIVTCCALIYKDIGLEVSPADMFGFSLKIKEVLSLCVSYVSETIAKTKKTDQVVVNPFCLDGHITPFSSSEANLTGVSVLSEVPDGDPEEKEEFNDIAKDTANFSEIFARLKDSEFADTLKKFCAVCSFSLVGQHILSSLGSFPTLVDVFEKLRYALDFTTFFDCFTSLCEKFVTDVMPVFTNWSLDSLKPSSYLVKVQAMSGVNAVRDGGFSAGGVREVLDLWNGYKTKQTDETALRLDFITALGEMLVYLQKSDLRNVSLMALNQQLLSAHSDLKNLLLTMERIMPLCIGCTGIPGSGKSSFLINRVPGALVDILGLSTRSEMKDGVEYHYPPAPVQIVQQNFQENITTHTQVIVFDDFGVVTTPVGQDLTVDAFWNIQSNSVAQVPKASITQKSGCFYNNKLTLISANPRNFNIQGKVSNIEAFTRRIHVHIHVSGTSSDPEYEVSAVEPGGVVRHEIELAGDTREERENNLVALIQDYATQYMLVAQRDRDRARSQRCLCAKCHFNPTKCICRASVLAVNTSVGAPGFCFIGRLLSGMEDSSTKFFYLFIAAISEELIVSQFPIITVDVATTPEELGIRHFSLFAPLWIMILRMILDCMTSQQFTLGNCVGYAFLTFVGSISVCGAICVHFLLNCLLFTSIYLTIREELIVVLFCFWNRHYPGQYVQLKKTTSGAFMTLNPKVVAQYSLEMMQRAYIEGYLKQFTRVSGGIFIVVVGFFYAGHKCFRWFQSEPIKEHFTAIGEPPTQADIDATAQLSSIVQSGFGGIQTGLAQTWKSTIHTLTGVASNGTVPNHIKWNLFRVKFYTLGDNFMCTGWGYYNSGKVLFCRHFLEHVRENYTKMTFTNEYDGQVIELTYSLSVVTLGVHDLAWIEWTGKSRKTAQACVTKCTKSYEYGVGVDLIPARMLGVTKEGTSTSGQPGGAYVLDFVSAKGLSGTPVFVTVIDGKSVHPILCGLLSRMLDDPNQPNQPHYGVVAPLDDSLLKVNFSLDKTVSTSDVIQLFQEAKMKLVESTHKHSILSHFDPASLPYLGEYCGSTTTKPFHQRSSFFKTDMYEKAVTFCPAVSDYGIPILRPRYVDGVWISSELAATRQMMNCGTVINETPLISAAKMVFEHIHSKISGELDSVAPLNMVQAIRGTAHTNPINMKAGAGFPFVELKKSHLVAGTVEEPVFKKWFADCLIAKLEQIDTGMPILNVSIANLKDEVISQKKISEGVERMFFAGNVEFLMLCRIYLTPYLDIFTAHRNELFGQIGMNAIGEELHNRVTQMMVDLETTIAQKTWLDSDYVKFDKLLSILRYGVWVLNQLINVTRFYMNNPIEMKRIKAILHALQQFIIILGNDVILMDKRQPSGVFLTTFLNCICEAILEVLQFYYCLFCVVKQQKPTQEDFVSIFAKDFPFFMLVRLLNFGDDNLKNVSEKVRHVYTHERIMDFALYIGMPITPARKHETRIEYKTIEEALFLKRTPTWNPRLGKLMGRLEINSIGRMLAFSNSHDPTWKDMVIDQALRELSYHPIEVFNRFKEIFGVEGDYEAMQDKAMKHVWTVEQQVDVMFEDDATFTYEIEIRPFVWENYPYYFCLWIQAFLVYFVLGLMMIYREIFYAIRHDTPNKYLDDYYRQSTETNAYNLVNETTYEDHSVYTSEKIVWPSQPKLQIEAATTVLVETYQRYHTGGVMPPFQHIVGNMETPPGEIFKSGFPTGTYGLLVDEPIHRGEWVKEEGFSGVFYGPHYIKQQSGPRQLFFKRIQLTHKETKDIFYAYVVCSLLIPWCIVYIVKSERPYIPKVKYGDDVMCGVKRERPSSSMAPPLSMESRIAPLDDQMSESSDDTVPLSTSDETLVVTVTREEWNQIKKTRALGKKKSAVRTRD